MSGRVVINVHNYGAHFHQIANLKDVFLYYNLVASYLGDYCDGGACVKNEEISGV